MTIMPFWRMHRAYCAMLAFTLATGALATDYAAPQRPPSLEPFLSDLKADEMTLALTAAPSSISSHADIMVLGRNGYELVKKGDNGWVCMSERSWSTDVNDNEFWNARTRQPACYNPPAVRSLLPTFLERTRWVLAGASLKDIDVRTRAEVAKGTIKTPEPGSIVYMMSKQGYLGDFLSKHPYPHLMFYFSKRSPEEIGAGETGVPVYSVDGVEQPFRIFFVLVPKWSDGTPAPGISVAK